MKGEDLSVLEQTTQLSHKRSYQRLPSQSHWKKLSRRLIIGEVWKKILPFVQLQGNPTVVSRKEQLYEQMKSKPLQREIYKEPTQTSKTQTQTPEQKSFSLRSKRFRASSSVKLRRKQKKEWQERVSEKK